GALPWIRQPFALLSGEENPLFWNLTPAALRLLPAYEDDDARAVRWATHRCLVPGTSTTFAPIGRCGSFQTLLPSSSLCKPGEDAKHYNKRRRIVDELIYASTTALAKAIRTKEVSSIEVIEAKALLTELRVEH